MLISQLVWILQGQKGPKFSYFLLNLFIFKMKPNKLKTAIVELFYGLTSKGYLTCSMDKKISYPSIKGPRIIG